MTNIQTRRLQNRKRLGLRLCRYVYVFGSLSEGTQNGPRICLGCLCFRYLPRIFTEGFSRKKDNDIWTGLALLSLNQTEIFPCFYAVLENKLRRQKERCDLRHRKVNSADGVEINFQSIRCRFERNFPAKLFQVLGLDEKIYQNQTILEYRIRGEICARAFRAENKRKRKARSNDSLRNNRERVTENQQNISTKLKTYIKKITFPLPARAPPISRNVISTLILHRIFVPELLGWVTSSY